jgi:hypothetical protein
MKEKEPNGEKMCEHVFFTLFVDILVRILDAVPRVPQKC